MNCWMNKQGDNNSGNQLRISQWTKWYQIKLNNKNFEFGKERLWCCFLLEPWYTFSMQWFVALKINDWKLFSSLMYLTNCSTEFLTHQLSSTPRNIASPINYSHFWRTKQIVHPVLNTKARINSGSVFQLSLYPPKELLRTGVK